MKQIFSFSLPSGTVSPLILDVWPVHSNVCPRSDSRRLFPLSSAEGGKFISDHLKSRFKECVCAGMICDITANLKPAQRRNLSTQRESTSPEEFKLFNQFLIHIVFFFSGEDAKKVLMHPGHVFTSAFLSRIDWIILKEFTRYVATLKPKLLNHLADSEGHREVVKNVHDSLGCSPCWS